VAVKRTTKTGLEPGTKSKKDIIPKAL